MILTIRYPLLLLFAFFHSTIMADNTDLNSTLNVNNTQAKVFYLVRHAEKLAGQDPSLSAQGKLRAMRLATVLSSTPLAQVFTTDYKRTQETALTVAKSQHLETTVYDPHNLPKTAEMLFKQQGHILVVGHSNTTTAQAEQLGADKQPAINDANEFDRLYIITLDINNRKVSTVILRY
ncbi:histidine phosphatase family protein [Shewanella sp.]|uniref:histidine phosphatase family protein n=1 Tax=Shewanella sp. TaxID=50422 RepID=UPI00404774CA